jgi:hypothetical protein
VYADDESPMPHDRDVSVGVRGNICVGFRYHRRMKFTAVVLALVACTHGGGAPTTPASTWHAPEQLGHVPADTPYMFVQLEPLPKPVRDALFAPIDARVVAAIDTAAAVPLEARAAMDAEGRAMLAVIDEMRGSDAHRWWTNLGFVDGAHWVFYGLSIWPVFRIEVADAIKLRTIAAHAMAAVPKIATKQLGAVQYWSAGSDEYTFVGAVLEHEAVVAFLPTRALGTMLPLVLGTERPAHSQRDVDTVPATIRREQLLSSTFGLVDTRRLADALDRRDALAPTTALATPECRGDLERIATLFPRIVFGYRELTATKFVGSFVVDIAPELAAQLAKLRTALPALPMDGPLFAVGAALDVDGAIELVRGWSHALHDRPLACGPLAGIGAAIASAATSLDKPLPPEAHGLRGFQLVVDDAQLDPPTGAGHLIVAGDGVALALTRALRLVPGLGGMNVGPDGHPYELPLGMLGAIGVRGLKGFVAMRAGRAAIAIGERSEADVVAALNAPNSEHTPLLAFVMDVKRLIERFPTAFKTSDANLRAFRTLILTVDVRDHAIVLDGTATRP